MAFNVSKEEDVYFPLVAIEEPEAHLHPNAQKQLYSQISTIKGQKIISTHSPYIAACAELSELRNFYKTSSVTTVGEFNIEKFNDEEIRKIKRMVMNTRGEVLFSKLLVFFEGETEEQALPIFAQDYFKQNPLELGIDFIGVSGYGNYPPFIKLADNLNIPWIIFSDGENDVIERVSSALKKIYGDSFDIRTHQNIILLSEECSFERYLIKENYIDEIKESFKLLYNETYLDTFVKKRQKKPKGRKPTSETCSKCKQTIYIDKTYEYSYEEAIYDCMIIKNQKTKLGPVLAGIIVESDKPLPSKVIELFKRIKVILSI